MERIKAKDLDQAFDDNKDITRFLNLATVRRGYAKKRKHFDALIFDLDGTLWDCSKASAAAFNLAYEKFALPQKVSRDFVKSISGKPSSECDKILLKDVPAPLKSEFSKQLDDFEIASVKNYAANALFTGVAAGLEILAKHYPLYLVSNCGEQYLKAFLSHTPVGHLFKDSECHGRTGLLKAENIRLLVQRQELSHPCYIGDTSSDEDAAYKTGLEFFYVSYGFGKQAGKNREFGSFGELVGYFAGIAN